MGMYSQPDIDFSRIGSEMASAVSPWMNATIQVVDQNTNAQTWDVVTNTYAGGNQTVVWSGRARVQQLTSFSTPDSAYQQIGVRAVRIQIPLDNSTGLIRAGMRVVVADGGNDASLEELSYIVKSAINSSYAWLRTIEAEADVKTPGGGNSAS